MIIVEPSASRFEAGPASLSTDEPRLARISAAENRVARLAERLVRSLDLLQRYAQAVRSRNASSRTPVVLAAWARSAAQSSISAS